MLDCGLDGIRGQRLNTPPEPAAGLVASISYFRTATSGVHDISTRSEGQPVANVAPAGLSRRRSDRAELLNHLGVEPVSCLPVVLSGRGNHGDRASCAGVRERRSAPQRRRRDRLPDRARGPRTVLTRSVPPARDAGLRGLAAASTATIGTALDNSIGADRRLREGATMYPPWEERGKNETSFGGSRGS
jgi:hypothetical protein